MNVRQGTGFLLVVLVLGLVAVGSNAGAQTPPPAPAPVPTGPPKLAVPDSGLYVGAYSPELARGPRQRLKLNRYKGSNLRIIHRFNAWWGTDRFLSDGWLRRVREAGAVPMVSWEPWRRPNGKVSDPNQRRGLLRQIAAGKYDAFVTRWARQIARTNHPFVMRFMHEMNGSWYPWSVGRNGNRSADFVAAWRHVRDVFVANGATNVSWVFSIESFAPGKPTSLAKLRRFWPGDDYVDWVGLSGFNWGRSLGYKGMTFKTVFKRVIPVVKKLNKPIMVAETGTVPNARSGTWVRRALKVVKRYAAVRAMVWYDGVHPAADFRLKGSGLSAFRSTGRRAYFSPPLKLGG